MGSETAENRNGQSYAHDVPGVGSRIPDFAILVVFCVVMTVQLLGPLFGQSATFDEPVNLTSGYLALRFGNVHMKPENLPLVKLLAGAPLLLSPDLALPASPPPWNLAGQYRYANRLLHSFNDADGLLLRGRIAVLPLTLILGWGIFIWTKQLFGRGAALFALILYAFEPNVLAHSALITTDIATACFMFWTLFGWYRLVQIVTWPRLGLTGLALGLSLISKFTALFLIPILLLIGAFIAISSRPLIIRLAGCAQRTLLTKVSKLLTTSTLILAMGLTAVVVIWTSYGFSYDSTVMPIPTYPATWESKLPDSPVLHSLLNASRAVRLLPDSYLYGLSESLGFRDTAEAYLLGEVRTGGWWHYFLITAAIKIPIPLLLFFFFALPARWNFWRTNLLITTCLLIPLFVYFSLISASGWNIGHRHLLPIYPQLIIVSASLVPWVVKQVRPIRAVLAGLVCWFVVSSISMFPHYLAYFNEFAGGPDNGHHYLVDSNLDWGQDLKGLKRYLDEEGIDRIWLSYFGQANPDYYRIRYDYLPSFDIPDAKNIDQNLYSFQSLPPLSGTIAISATLLQGEALSTFYGLSPSYFEFYRRQQPIAKIGYSIFIFRVQ